MEISLQQLSQCLQRNLAPMYLISGDEYLLVDEALTFIRETAKKHDFTSRESFTVDKNFDWQFLASLLNNLSLFADKSLIELKISNNKLNNLSSKILQNYAENPASDKLLIIITDKLDAATKKTQWYKSINQSGISITIWKLDQKQFLSWIINKLKKCKITLDTEGISLLYDYVEGNLLAASQEIEKLKILYGSVKITTEELLKSITESTEYNVYDLMECALLGDISKIIRILKHLRDEGFEPAIILWAITRELRNLITISLKTQKGEDLEQILQQQRVRPNQKIAIKKVVQEQKLTRLEKILISTSKIDFTLKGAYDGDVWTEIEQILFTIATGTHDNC